MVALTAALCVPGGAGAAPAKCLAAPSLAASGHLGYRPRGQRCEGLLRRLVANSSAIELLGYHVGTVDFDVLQKQPLALSIVGEGTDKEISLRARGVTANSVYQMDSTPAKLVAPFPWPNEVAASSAQPNAGDGKLAIDLKQFGVVACSDRCVQAPDTVYWPVQAVVPQGSAGSGLSLVLRSDADGTRLQLRLKSEADGTVTELSAPDLGPQGVATVRLPDTLPKGMYKMTVQGRDKQTRDPMGALFARIYIPGPRN